MVCFESSICKGNRRNNTGVMQRRANTADTSSDEWDRVLAINLRGVFLQDADGAVDDRR
jgi:NAD(P)-dependent dehydrogenase (short-subunit alcohol dehydrogenase family)